MVRRFDRFVLSIWDSGFRAFGCKNEAKVEHVTCGKRCLSFLVYIFSAYVGFINVFFFFCLRSLFVA